MLLMQNIMALLNNYETKIYAGINYVLCIQCIIDTCITIIDNTCITCSLINN